MLLPAVLLIGVGFMLLFPTLNIQATTGVADREQGVASGLVQIVVPARRSARPRRRHRGRLRRTADGDVFGAYRTAVGVALAVSALGLLTAVVGLAREPRARPALAEAD